ncbi:MAG: hypothetical protein SFU99_10340, partial [Saprospiraceae bacterium]|nr:hypothetical protein [Saprospiraceae bacterium]
MPNFSDQIHQIKAARDKLREAEHSLYLAKLNIQKTQNPTSYASVREQLSGVTNAYETARTTLSTSIGALYQLDSTKNLVKNLSADYPILFLPVRLETRFVNVGTQQQLWIRIYPDDIHIHSHEALLTDEEYENGKKYWKALLSANRGAENEREQAKQQAWQYLLNTSGAQRSLWIAKQTKPSNWSPNLTIAEEALQFPAKSDTKTHSWTLAPRTQLLPDCFAVILYKGDQEVKTQIGNLIPDTVFMGPDPFRAEEAFKKTDEKIELDEDFAWISNFEKAVEIGLGLKIDLAPSFFNNNQIDRVLVMGILASATPEESALLVENMIENHRFSKGFSLVPQGTATNNTEKDSSGYSKNEQTFEKGYFDGSESAYFQTVPDSEGKRLTDALG